MTYSDLVSALKAYLIIDDDGTDPTSGFVVALPRIIEQAELRCFRDVDFLIARTSGTVALVNGTATYSTPSGWLFGRAFNVPGVGRLLRRDETFLHEYWPDSTLTGTPKYWTEPTAGTLLVAPTPATSYTARAYFTARLAGLSESNTTTWLSTNAPDLLLYAALLAGNGWKMNFGAASSDPQQAMSWEQQYQAAKLGAEREEARRKAEGYFESAVSPSPPPSSTSS